MYGPNLAGVSFLLLIVAIVAIAAWIISISKLVKIAEDKGQSTGSLWLIGLFASPIVLGLIVCAMPDRGEVKAQKPAEPELPSI